MDSSLSCPSCGLHRYKKNGLTHHGKQNYQCKSCGRQFVENGTAWFISEETKELINRLLLERISLSGICRSCQVSKTWLLSYIKELYSSMPDDLYVETELPDLEHYLDDRFDEEVQRLEVLKKIQGHLKSINRLKTKVKMN